MRRLLTGLVCATLLVAFMGCQSHCTNCRGGGNSSFFGKNRGGEGAIARHGGAHYRPETEPAGGPVPQNAYPYYTLRGPRDFLAANPPSIGPY